MTADDGLTPAQRAQQDQIQAALREAQAVAARLSSHPDDRPAPAELLICPGDWLWDHCLNVQTGWRLGRLHPCPHLDTGGVQAAVVLIGFWSCASCVNCGLEALAELETTAPRWCHGCRRAIPIGLVLERLVIPDGTLIHAGWLCPACYPPERAPAGGQPLDPGDSPA